ncbi:MAG: DUF4402 domain-containing protein [Planctomycetota bacterium]
MKCAKARLGVVWLAAAVLVSAWSGGRGSAGQWLGGGNLWAGDDGMLLADFETAADKSFEDPPMQVIVKEHAKSGEHSLKITYDGKGYPGIAIASGAVLKHFGQYPIFAVDIFNPSQAAVQLHCRADDAQSHSYGTRYNDDGLVAPPGWSTLRVNLTGMTTSNSNNFLDRRPLDVKTLKLFNIFVLENGKPAQPIVLYFDNVRLEGTGLPTVEGLQAYDFGPSSSAVFPGFVGVNEKSVYSAKTGFGWRTPMRARRPGNPDDLGGDYGSGDQFEAQMKAGPGEYVVQMCIDSLGEWGAIQNFKDRTVTIDGKEVLHETMDGAQFMKERYFKYMDDDDLPGIDLWNERVMPLTPVRTFTTTVGADGKLTVAVDATGGWPGLITFLVAYPKAKQAEGDAFMAALNKRRKNLFDNAIVVQATPADHPKPTPTAAETAQGFIWFGRSPAEDIGVNSAPSDAERSAPLTLVGCATERLGVQLGLEPLRDAKALTVAVGDLAGPNGVTIPGSAVVVRKVRIFAKRQGGTNMVVLTPYLLQPFTALPLTKDVTRSVWLTLTVPAGTAAGAYTGSVSVTVDGQATAVPMQLTVYGFKLSPVDDISLSGMGTTAGSWRNLYPGFDAQWWKSADAIMADQAAHGFNALTGGPGMRLTGVQGGQAQIDFGDADRWMALAKKHGLTMPGDSYQGFDVNMGFYVSQAKDCMATNEKHAQEKWGVSFADLVKMVYAKVAEHAKEQGWPERSYYLLDEPRPEFGNIDSALALLKLYAQAAPETRFSGYTTVRSEGRDRYIPYLPVVISHPTEAEMKAVKAAGKEIWDYDVAIPGHEFGRWLYAAQRKGLSGFDIGFMYVNSTPYYDFSDTEGSWGIVQPAPDGDIATTKWERFAAEVNCYRYLKTLQEAVSAAKQVGKNAAAVQAGQAFLDQLVASVEVGKHASAHLDDAEWAKFQTELVGDIQAVEK